MCDFLQRLDLSYLADLLKNSDNEDRANEILQEYSKKHMVDVDDLVKVLATKWDCTYCSSCGKFFSKDRIANFTDNKCLLCL